MSAQEELEAVLKKYGIEQGAVKLGGGGGWGAQETEKPPIEGVSIPINMNVPGGKLRMYLSLPASVMESFEKLMATLEGLAAMGLPLDVWKPKKDFGGGGNRGAGGGGGNWGNKGGW